MTTNSTSTSQVPGAANGQPPASSDQGIPSSGATEQPSLDVDGATPAPSLALEPDILTIVATEIERRGVVGEQQAVKLLYLALTTRLFDNPVSVAVKGPSSGGKSNLVRRVLDLIPEEGYVELTSMSEKALVYSAESFSHRFLVIYEASGVAGEFQSYVLRSLLSEGRIRYETVESTANGLHPRTIEKEGPTGLVLTTTAASLHPENETRMFSLNVNDDPEQTRRILIAQAAQAEGGQKPDVAFDDEPFIEYQRWLAADETRVVVPFATAIAKGVDGAGAVRLRRDFKAILSLIAAHALIHRETRGRDATGAVIATVVDYEAVHGLVADLLAEGLAVSVPAPVRETAEAVTALAADGGPVTNGRLASYLGLHKGTISRRVQRTVEAGFIVDLQAGRPGERNLVPGAPLPDNAVVLPPPDQIPSP